jgi:type II secretory pathway component GspD/PulD (secretin)
MNPGSRVFKIRKSTYAATMLLPILAGVMLAREASAQATDQKPCDAKRAEARLPDTYQAFHLTSVAQVNDANELQTSLRNILPPGVRVFYDASQNAILIRATADDMQLAQKMISEMDKPKKTYRLTYTITEVDNGKPQGKQHMVMIVFPGERTVLKQGNRVPVVTGVTEADGPKPNTQMQYVDIGLSIDATLEPYGDGFLVRTKVEQSAVADEKSTVGLQNPVIRQSVLDEALILGQGKPLVVGSMDIPGTTRHEEIEVLAEQAK